MSLPPVEIPLGAMRFNSDSQKLEYWNGSAWMQIQTFTPNLDGGERGIFMGRNGSSVSRTIQFITIPTTGNATDFGDLTNVRSQLACCSSRTRGFAAGGESPGLDDEIEFVTFSSTGNSTDFGNLVRAKRRMTGAGCSNATRGLFNGGYRGSPSATLKEVDYITMSHAGNAQDFGDLVNEREFPGCFASPTRGVVVGGRTQTPSPTNPLAGGDFYTIPTTGDASRFNNLTERNAQSMYCANSTRGVIGGGTNPTQLDTLAYYTLSSLGEETEFGSLTSGSNYYSNGSFANSTRAVQGGGISPGNPNGSNIIDYVNIATGGTSIDFGDMIDSTNNDSGGCSNGHGGLG